ncbi:cytochrome c oxidase assembly protein COX15 homolog [Gigantopelta aegis]|uniref:cytochrome c oxidase assembly protein COX15 homolog n=1 Tax=Gigantopelta aegis TaxID=1735272 RepID=UPI001B888750|nr:cytochrome c oxidase assembly protein COX15 homolog [Gigantopelta aegis]
MLSTLGILRSSMFRSNMTVGRSFQQVARMFGQLQCPRCLRILPVQGTRQMSQTLTKQIKPSKPIFARFNLVNLIQRTTTQAQFSDISPQAQKIVGWWLMGCAVMCFGAVVLGGVTRLTESGLSMVDWRLIKDMRPPRNEQEWEEEFENYKKFPEYQYFSSRREVTLSDFKFIFYMEWFHRLWGRTTGLVFALPAIFFWKKGWIAQQMKKRIVIYGALIGFQGFMGWYMVKSGLKDDIDIPRVSQYRLSVHLGTAIFLYSLFLFGALGHLSKPGLLASTKQISKLRGMAHGVMTMAVVTAISGAFVAGLDAGLTYNSWPKMADKWFPDDLWANTPKWKNIFENPTTVQFIHRHLAEATIIFIGFFWWVCRKSPVPQRVKLAASCCLWMSVLQAALGISTLLMYVPTHLAATHQAGSLVLVGFGTWLAHELKRLPKI